jgi:small conductance mechanosensitive channel
MQVDKIYNELSVLVVHKGPSILVGILVLFIGLWLIKLMSKSLSAILHRKRIDPTLKPFLTSLIITTLRILLIIGVMQIMGIQLTIFAALIAAVGVAAGLALSGTLQNFASGILILMLKPFEVGDNIIAQGQEGTVTSIQIFYTIVTTFDNQTVIVPNSKLSNEVIINVSKTGKRRMDIELKFSNSVDFKDVKQKIDKAIAESPELFSEPERRIGISSIESDGYKVMLNVWVNAHGFTDTKMAFQQKLMETLNLYTPPKP